MVYDSVEQAIIDEKKFLMGLPQDLIDNLKIKHELTPDEANKHKGDYL